MLVYIPLIIILFVGALFFYKGRKVKWKEELLVSDEKVLYQQPKTTLYTVRAENSKRGMAWLWVKLTNKRIFFLYPDKKGITLVLDFTNTKENTLSGVLENATIYIERSSMKIEEDALGRGIFRATGTNFMGQTVGYEFKIHDTKKVKEILSL